MIPSAWIDFAGRWGGYALARQYTRNHPRILMYHRFTSDTSAGTAMADVFEEQVRHLAEHFNVMTLGELLASFHAGERPPPHTIVITVDDGHRDFFEFAWPILKRHNVPATLFVATGFIDRELWLWPDQVTWLLGQCGSLAERVQIGGESVELGDNPWQAIVDRILAMSDDNRLRAPSELAEKLGCALPSEAPEGYAPVTWDELRVLEANGVEIGGHTHTHPNLARVPENRLPEEIHRCRERLDSELGMRPRPFCYPNGQPSDVTQAVRAAVKDAGFTGAVMAYADGALHEDVYQLRRHSSSSNPFQFYKASSGVEWLGRRWRRGGLS